MSSVHSSGDSSIRDFRDSANGRGNSASPRTQSHHVLRAEWNPRRAKWQFALDEIAKRPDWKNGRDFRGSVELVLASVAKGSGDVVRLMMAA